MRKESITRIDNKATEFIGSVYENNNGNEFTIINYENSRKVTIVFTNTKSVQIASMGNIRTGKVQDVFEPTSYGRGYLGDSKRKEKHWKKAMQLWRNVMKRCYSDNDAKGYRGKTIVSNRWLNFSNFSTDLCKLENYNEWLNNKGFELDKDKVGDGSIYDLHTCLFLSKTENRQLQKNYRVGKTFDNVNRVWR